MKLTKRFAACAVACFMAIELTCSQVMPLEASSISSIQQQINKNQNALNQVNQQIDEYEAKMDEYLSYLDDQKSEMINLMKDIAYYEAVIEEKAASIETATQELVEANAQREAQYAAMVVRLQYMYESGNNDSYLLMLLTSQDFADLLNRAEYVDSLYAYDKAMLSDYEQLVSDITEMRENLEVEKHGYEEEQRVLNEHRAELEVIMADLEDKVADYEVLVANAEAKAKEYKKQIASGEAQIQKIKEQQAAAAAAGNKPSGSSDKVVGTGTGAQVAEYALQFVGNPYVYGGTSLTGGADCSGFIMSIYAQFGYSLPHSSLSLRSSGVGVSLAEAKAGDIICYQGHVALYIGNGRIVHAKNSKYGIVTDPVYYGWGGAGPTVLAVRRIIN